MNAIFLLLTTLSLISCILYAPDNILPAFLSGAQKSITLAISLTAVYVVWLGIFELAEKSGVSNKIAKLMQKPVGLLFKNTSTSAKKLICLNISANALGLSGVATPLGIQACTLLERQNNQSASELLFIISATSVQILPTSVLALASSYGSLNPSAIILPSLLTTGFSTALGIFLHKLLSKKQT